MRIRFKQDKPYEILQPAEVRDFKPAMQNFGERVEGLLGEILCEHGIKPVVIVDLADGPNGLECHFEIEGHCTGHSAKAIHFIKHESYRFPGGIEDYLVTIPAILHDAG